jgi:hypothetical protein
MRSYFVYVRTTDNQFFSGSVALESPDHPKTVGLVYQHFADKGNPLPPARFIYSMRLLADHRNLMDRESYEAECAERRGEDTTDGYVAYSEYVSGTTPTH